MCPLNVVLLSLVCECERSVSLVEDYFAIVGDSNAVRFFTPNGILFFLWPFFFHLFSHTRIVVVVFGGILDDNIVHVFFITDVACNYTVRITHFITRQDDILFFF
jgi:hypothetical protein